MATQWAGRAHGHDEMQEAVTDVPIEEFAAAGRLVDHVNVAISYGIIERFSEGLYSSPNKTFEELVTNSYDAGAKKVWVSLPNDLKNSSSAIVVLDDGESMDLDGLRDLWRIGESRKRSGEGEPSGRDNPVGKFGIGKLATYVLAHKLTYIAHRGDEYLAVTMDYSRVSNESRELLERDTLRLQVVSLERGEALSAIKSAVSGSARNKQILNALRGSAEPRHWTAAVLTNLKETAGNISKGRLKWVLRTALPLNPNFNLWYDDEKLLSSKANEKVQWSFVCGQDEGILPALEGKPWTSGSRTTVRDDENQSRNAYRLPVAGVVWGRADLYEKPLERGKSEEHGRSHGIFVRVRGRLINQNSVDFEIRPQLRLGTLTRFRMEINADDLDDEVASARESLKEGAKLTELMQYISAVFNKARNSVSDADKKDHMSLIKKDGRLSDPPPALSQAPLRRMLQKVVDGDEPTREAIGIRENHLHSAKQILDNKDDLLAKVLLDDLGDDRRLVAYDPDRRAAVVNEAHPFIRNYVDVKQAGELLRMIALTELLTEAYMLDEDVPSDVVARVVARRDQFLRDLAHRNPRSAPVVASRLRDAATDEDALEDAVGDALNLLGFQVRRLGGPSHGTDGIATARLGRRAEPRSDSYAFTYDAKSSGRRAIDALKDPTESESKAKQPAKRIRADTARTSILRVHREKAAQIHGLEVEPEFTLLVAPAFQGQDDEKALINDVCRNDGITAISVNDLARLVELFPLQGLNPLDLRDLFNRRSPQETSDWVDEQQQKTAVSRPPIAKVVSILVDYSERKGRMTISALGGMLATEGYDLDDEEVAGLVRGLHALAPKSVFADGTVVALNASPGALLREIDDNLNEYDQELVGPYREAMAEAAEDE